MDFDQDLEHLAYLDESESSRYESRAVFSDVGIGVEVEEYDGFTLYEWRSDVSFEELIECIEPFFPFSENPGLEMVKEEGLRRNVDRDHETMENNFIYDPVREWRGEDRWSEYSLIQVNLTDGKVVYDTKEGQPRLRVYEISGNSDLFEKVFQQTEGSEEAENILDDIRSSK